MRLAWLLLALVGCAAKHDLPSYRASTPLAEPHGKGAIRVLVTDETNLPVPGAQLDLTGDRGTLTQVTNDLGQFVFTGLPPGSYTLDVTRPGFTGQKLTNVIVNGGRETTLPVQLTPGGARTEVVVVGQKAVDTTSTARSQLLTKDFLQQVPTGRSYQQAVQVATGAQQSGANPNFVGAMGNEDPRATGERSAEARMVHYSGWMRLGVTRVREEHERLAALAGARGGRVEALSGATIVLRVPVAAYREVWAEIRGDGDVLAENQTAADVTEQFTSVDLRVKTARVTRDRLVVLLAKAESEQDKVTLLRELLRVTEELDGLESQLRALRGLADFSRIAVEVVQKGALAAANGPDVDGFEWIAWLSPFGPLESDARRVALDVPAGMVELQPRGQLVAESPEGARLSTTRIPNDPRADAGFWIAAIAERLAPDFASAERSTVGDWACVRLVDGSDDPYTWEICARGDVAERTFDLAQAYYPDNATLARYGADVRAALTRDSDGVAEGGG